MQLEYAHKPTATRCAASARSSRAIKGPCVLMTVCAEANGGAYYRQLNCSTRRCGTQVRGRCGHINMSGIIPVCAHQHMNTYVTFKKDYTACARREGCMQVARIPGLFECGCNFKERHEGQAGSVVNCVHTLREHRASDRVSGCTPCTARRVGVAKWALLCPLLWALLTRQLPRVHHLRRHHKNNVLENDFYGIKCVGCS
jgi:hypothetical protein